MRPQLYTNYKQLRNAKSQRTSLPQRQAYQPVIQYQMVSPENIHKSNIIQADQAVFMYLGTHKHKMKTETMNLKERKEGYTEG